MFLVILFYIEKVIDKETRDIHVISEKITRDLDPDFFKSALNKVKIPLTMKPKIKSYEKSFTADFSSKWDNDMKIINRQLSNITGFPEQKVSELRIVFHEFLAKYSEFDILAWKYLLPEIVECSRVANGGFCLFEKAPPRELMAFFDDFHYGKLDFREILCALSELVIGGPKKQFEILFRIQSKGKAFFNSASQCKDFVAKLTIALYHYPEAISQLDKFKLSEGKTLLSAYKKIFNEILSQMQLEIKDKPTVAALVVDLISEKLQNMKISKPPISN